MVSSARTGLSACREITQKPPPSISSQPGTSGCHQMGASRPDAEDAGRKAVMRDFEMLVQAFLDAETETVEVTR